MSEIELQRAIPTVAFNALTEVLKANYPHFAGLNSWGGRYFLVFDTGVTPEESNGAIQDALAFDTNQRSTAEQNEASDIVKTTAAKTTAKNIPGWATWDEAAVLAWINGKFDATTINNITTLAQAKPVMADMATAITALARMVVALRDKTWPDLDRS